MKVIIDIPEESYKYIKTLSDLGWSTSPEYANAIRLTASEYANAIKNGTPLPKGHGRLIDADKTLAIAWQNFYKHEDEWEHKDENYIPIHRFHSQLGFECCQQTIVNAPTIIEADAERE